MREFKGKSLIAAPSSYTIIDIETTGLDPARDEIIEVSALKVRNGVVVDTFSTLVNPDVPLSDFIVEFTGITQEMLDDIAPNITGVMADMQKFIADDILIGHNVNFDINFLYDAFIKHLGEPLKNDFVDTLRLARATFRNLPHHTLSFLAYELNLPAEVEHRALGDCECTFELYKTLVAEMINQKGSVDDFITDANKSKKATSANIECTAIEIDETHPAYNQVFVFTGRLDKMTRSDAMQMVVNLGGKTEDSVKKNVNYLVLGNFDYVSGIKGGKSTKHKKAESLKLGGQDINIISEDVFYDVINQ